MMLRRLKEDVEKNLASKEETIVEVWNLFASLSFNNIVLTNRLMTIMGCKLPSFDILINMVNAYNRYMYVTL